jgi:hypothetical protein
MKKRELIPPSLFADMTEAESMELYLTGYLPQRLIHIPAERLSAIADALGFDEREFHKPAGSRPPLSPIKFRPRAACAVAPLRHPSGFQASWTSWQSRRSDASPYRPQ